MTAMANSAVHEKIPAQSSTHGVVVDLRPPTPIVEDRTRVPQEQRDSLSVLPTPAGTSHPGAEENPFN